MTFLPIVERELRVATRRRSTYWLRVCAAGVASLLASGMLVLTLIPFGGPMSGSAMFATLTWMSLAVVLSSGLFFTSDCLSEEKREGTLGFLFLTDLRGYDVVLGKLLATSLRSVFPVIAVFPILATTMLIGGVEVGHFWRCMLAIANAAFFSLATGLFVSSISRHALKALAGTLLILILFVGICPFLDSLGSLVNGRFVPRLSLASPGYSFVSANYPAAFWPSLIVSQATAWFFLGVACFLVRRTWQERPASRWETKFSTLKRSSAGHSLQDRQQRLRLLDKNPVGWLATRDRGHALLLWIVVGTMLAAFAILLITDAPTLLWDGWSWVHYIVSLMLYLWVAAKACQFFAEARRSGALELLLASPLTSRETAHGAWQGLLRLFALPVILLVSLQMGRLVIVSGNDWANEEYGWVQAVAMGLNTVVTLTSLVALAWFGLWMGLTSKNTLTATLKTITFVMIIPWCAIWFLTIIGVMVFMALRGWGATGGAAGPAATTVVVPMIVPIVPSVLGLLGSILFWRAARKKLFCEFRQLATRSITPVHTTVLPPIIKVAT